MEALLGRVAVPAAILLSLGASFRTTNFVVNAPTAELAEQIGQAAEGYRRDLSLSWLGYELPRWSEPCPIRAQVGNMGAGGVTQFNFDQRTVFGWQMAIQGSRKRILDSVLPHEVTHTIFATHFLQPLPRWADEGACTTVEHPEERSRQQNMLVQFLQTGRGISFTKMFAMKEYPRDILPLYSQGYSLARFFVEQGGRRKFVKYVEEGLKHNQWEAATTNHYDYSDMLQLQNAWLDWVRKGSPKMARPRAVADAGTNTTLAAGKRRRSPETNLIVRGQSDGSSSPASQLAGPLVPIDRRSSVAANVAGSRIAALASSSVRAGREDGWRAIGTPRNATGRVASIEQEKRPLAAVSAPVRSQVTRPPPVEKSRQVIMQWSRQPPDGPSSSSQSAPGPARRRSIYDASRSPAGTIRR